MHREQSKCSRAESIAPAPSTSSDEDVDDSHNPADEDVSHKPAEDTAWPGSSSVWRAVGGGTTTGGAPPRGVVDHQDEYHARRCHAFEGGDAVPDEVVSQFPREYEEGIYEGMHRSDKEREQSGGGQDTSRKKKKKKKEVMVGSSLQREEFSPMDDEEVCSWRMIF